MLLSVLIPTYNRGKLLSAAILRLRGLISDSCLTSDDIEVVVADNASSDDTAVIVSNLVSSFSVDLVYQRWNCHLPTAEENVFRSYSLCRGRFVWTLCDDDIPRSDGFERLIALLKDDKRAERLHLLITNSVILDENHCLWSPSSYALREEYFEAPLLSMILSMGFWFVFAGFSSTVIRNSPELNLDLLKSVPIGADRAHIYSHVFAYILGLGKDANCMASRWGLVNYTVARDDSDRWRRHSLQIGECFEYPWTYGFLKLLTGLENSLSIESPLLFEIIETNGRDVFSPARVVVEKLFRQTHYDVKTRIFRESIGSAGRPCAMSDQQFNFVKSYFERCDSTSMKRCYVHLVRLIGQYREAYLNSSYFSYIINIYNARRELWALKQRITSALDELGNDRGVDFIETVDSKGRPVYRVNLKYITFGRSMHFEEFSGDSVREFFRDPANSSCDQLSP